MNAIVGGLVVGLLGFVVILRIRQGGAPPPGAGPPPDRPPAPPTEPAPAAKSPALMLLEYERLMLAQAEQQAAEARHKRLVDDWAASRSPFWAAPKPPSEAPKA